MPISYMEYLKRNDDTDIKKLQYQTLQPRIVVTDNDFFKKIDYPADDPENKFRKGIISYIKRFVDLKKLNKQLYYVDCGNSSRIVFTISPSDPVFDIHVETANECRLCGVYSFYGYYNNTRLTRLRNACIAAKKLAADLRTTREPNIETMYHNFKMYETFESL